MTRVSIVFHLLASISLLTFFYPNVEGYCMTGQDIERSFVVDGKCYWLIEHGKYSGWTSAVEACARESGEIAVVTSDGSNAQVALNLHTPAFIGYHKSIYGNWTWGNPNYTYSSSFTDNSAVHMAITDQTGEWEATHMDAKGHLYDLLCSLDQDPYLKCPWLVVAQAYKSRSMPVFSGENITFTCVEGHHVTVGITVQEFACLPPNKWSYAARDCKPIECDLIEPPAYTTRNSEAHYVGDSVLYECTNDTWFGPEENAKIFECTGSGEWSPPLHSCYFIRCEPPPSLTHGQLDSTTTLLDHEITYACSTGYILSDGSNSVTIKCTGNPPHWEPAGITSNITCERIYCDDDPAVGLLTWSEPPRSLAVGQYQIWWCIQGYIHPNNEFGTTPLCLKSNNPDVPHDWDRSVPNCFEVGCSLPEPEHAILDSNFSLPVYGLGQVLTFNCSGDSYLFSGGYRQKTVVCTESGEWDFSIALSGCDDSSCETGWQMYDGSCYYVSNGNSNGLRYEYAEEFCTYRHAHLAVIESVAEAEWLSTVTYDIYERDFWIGYHEGGDGQWVWKGDFRNNFTYFAAGYPEFYKCARTSVNGFWKDRDCDQLLPYVCKKTSICGTSPVIAHGSAVSPPVFPVNVGAKISYVCDEGYIFRGIGFNQTIECKQGGFWTEIANCVEDVCSLVNTPAREVENAWPDTTANSLGSKVTYTCNDGTLFPDGSRQKEIECLPGGLWSSLPPACESFRCPKPAVPDTTPEVGYDEWGDMDYYRCEPGYSFEDAEIDKLFWCTRDGTWLPKGEHCIRRACPKYSVPFAVVMPDEGVYEDVIEVECYHGFHFPDTSHKKLLTCTAEGVWSEDLPACKPTECAGPTPPDVEGAYRDTDVIYSGTVVNYTCLFELVYLNGDKWRLAYCDVDTLEWMNVPSNCVDEPVAIKTSHYHPAVEGKNGPAYFGIGLGCVVTIICLVILADGFTITRLVPCLKKKAAEVPQTNDVNATETPIKPLQKVDLRKANRWVEEETHIKKEEMEDEASGSEYESESEYENESGEETGSEYETDPEEK